MKSLIKFLALFLWACSLCAVGVTNSGSGTSCSLFPNPSSSEPMEKSGTIEEIIHDGHEFIAVGSGTVDEDKGLHQSLILTSIDGKNWKQPQKKFFTSLYAAAHANNTTIAIGHEFGWESVSNQMLRSRNRGEWQSLPIPGRAKRIEDIAYGNGIFVMTAKSLDQKDITFISKDEGNTWTAITLGDRWGSPKIKFGGGHFSVYGGTSYVAISTDGKKWQFSDIGSFVRSDESRHDVITIVNYLGWHQDTLYGIGKLEPMEGENKAIFIDLFSPNGGTWKVIRNPAAENIKQVVSEGDSNFAISDDSIYRHVGSIGKRSPDWQKLHFAPPETSYLTTIAHHDGITVIGSSDALFVSSDGENFEPAKIKLVDQN